jgi:hypothetical protein
MQVDQEYRLHKKNQSRQTACIVSGPVGIQDANHYQTSSIGSINNGRIHPIRRLAVMSRNAKSQELAGFFGVRLQPIASHRVWRVSKEVAAVKFAVTPQLGHLAL